MSAAKPQRNTNKRLYWQLIAPLKTANVPEPFHNQLDETEITGGFAESSTEDVGYADQSNQGSKLN